MVSEQQAVYWKRRSHWLLRISFVDIQQLFLVLTHRILSMLDKVIIPATNRIANRIMSISVIWFNLFLPEHSKHPVSYESLKATDCASKPIPLNELQTYIVNSTRNSISNLPRCWSYWSSKRASQNQHWNHLISAARTSRNYVIMVTQNCSLFPLIFVYVADPFEYVLSWHCLFYSNYSASWVCCVYHGQLVFRD